MQFTFLEKTLFYLLLLFLPTQFGKHFWPDFSIVSGIRIDYLSPTLYVTDVLIGLLFIVWLINRHPGKSSASRISYRSNESDSGQARMTSNGKLLTFSFGLLTSLFLFINIFLSQNIVNGLYHLFKILEFSFFGYYVATSVTNFKQLQNVTVALAYAAIFESALAIWQFFNHGSIGGIFYFLGERMFNASTPGITNASINGELILRPYGTLPHPNVLAGFLLVVMLLTFWLYGKTKETWQKNTFAFCLLLGTAALLLTMSRVPILLWIIFLFGLFIKIKHTALRNKYLLLGGFIILLGCLLVTPVGSRILGTRLTEESVVQRQELVSASITLFQQHSLLGVGFGNFLPSLPTVQKPVSQGLYLQPVHNIFLLVLVETGIIGFGFFLLFLAKTYQYLLKRRATHFGFLLTLTSLLILGMFDHYSLTLQQGQLFFALVLGLCWTHLENRE